ncbi:MAG: S8 family serine peptidase, partial [Gemmatimonadota bacterium]
EPIAPFSSRGGEIAGPDIVVPGAAYSTVPNYSVGDELENGTSMASPFAAGLAARLLSGARASSRMVNAQLIRQALRMGGRRLPSGSAIDQGAGLPDISRAWSWLAAAHDFVDIAVDVGAVKGRGAVLLTANPAAPAGQTLGARVTLRRLDSGAPITLRLITGDSWIRLPETVTLTSGRGEFTVAAQPTAIPGVLSGSIWVEGPDETTGPIAVIPVTVRIPVPASGTRTPLAIHQEAGGVGRVFIPADSGRGMQIEVATIRSEDRIAAALHEPGGMPFRDDRTIAAGFGPGAGMFDIDASDVVSGMYEVDIEAGRFGAADAKVSVRQSPLRIGATLARDTLHVTARSLVANQLSVRIRAGLIGAERRITVTGKDDAPIRVAIPVPEWATRTVVDTRMPAEAWGRFTDFGLTFLDRRGREIESTPINYAFSRATPELPDSIAGDSLIVMLSPGFADPADAGAWTIDLSVRFYVQTPYSLDGGGSPVKPVAGGALREERFAPGALPIKLPPGFVPLVTIVALEGTDHIWTREITPTRAPGAPR